MQPHLQAYLRLHISLLSSFGLQRNTCSSLCSQLCHLCSPSYSMPFSLGSLDRSYRLSVALSCLLHFKALYQTTNNLFTLAPHLVLLHFCQGLCCTISLNYWAFPLSQHHPGCLILTYRQCWTKFCGFHWKGCHHSITPNANLSFCLSSVSSLFISFFILDQKCCL